jgi:sarcosine oxidase delta subunit
MSNFTVLTCLSCGKRTLFEFQHRGETHLKYTMNRDCSCGQKDWVTSSFSAYANAKKLAAMPLKEQFKLMYQALQSKREVVKLVIEMIDTLTAVVNKAELADDLEPLKEVLKWLKQMVIGEVNQLQKETEGTEGTCYPVLDVVHRHE